MEEDETVLSEVHLDLRGVSSTETNVISRFEFTLPPVVPVRPASVSPSLGKDISRDDPMRAVTDSGTSESSRLDEATSKLSSSEQLSSDVQKSDHTEADSETTRDQSPPRRSRPSEVILIEHHMATTLAKVGFQVWPAALLMADFLIHRGDRWKNCTLLEIGGGVGLCGIVAAMFAKRTICTDYLVEIVDSMERNFERNSALLNGEFECRLLDVKSVALRSGYASSFSLSQSSSDEVPSCDVIFASDIIYSDEITKALIAFVKGCLQLPTTGGAREFYLSLERRLNFTMESLAVSCPAYDYFVELCEQSNLIKETVDLREIPTYFQYERSPYLELYRITLNSPTG